MPNSFNNISQKKKLMKKSGIFIMKKSTKLQLFLAYKRDVTTFVLIV